MAYLLSFSATVQDRDANYGKAMIQYRQEGLAKHIVRFHFLQTILHVFVTRVLARFAWFGQMTFHL